MVVGDAGPVALGPAPGEAAPLGEVAEGTEPGMDEAVFDDLGPPALGPDAEPPVGAGELLTPTCPTLRPIRGAATDAAPGPRSGAARMSVDPFVPLPGNLTPTTTGKRTKLITTMAR